MLTLASLALASVGLASDKLDAELAGAVFPAPALIEVGTVAPLARPTRDPGESALDFRRRLVDHLREQARISQAGLRERLDQAGIGYRSYWLGNLLALRADGRQLQALATRGDVVRIHADRPMRHLLPQAEPVQPREIAAVEWGVDRIRAPLVWAQGITGEGVVVAGQDTGVRWDHQALQRQYRGWDGEAVDHNHHWHDAIHEEISPAINPCGLSSAVPCDDHNHGTHTVGTVVGDDGGPNQIGVAPGARWIACRNMESGYGLASTYTECFQWFLAPTDLAGGDPDVALAPDVINNSWGCPASEGCTSPTILEDVVRTVREAGIVVVVSAGNDGSSCATISTPAAIYDASFTVGSSTSAEAMSGFSSRGPAIPAGIGTRMKPDVVAPGSTIRSATRASTSSYGNSSGTSMAGPHVAGLVALLIQADPNLRGDVGRIERIIRDSTVPVSNAQTCGGIGPDVLPNFVVGHGRIDAWNAFLIVDTLFADDFD